MLKNLFKDKKKSHHHHHQHNDELPNENKKRIKVNDYKYDEYNYVYDDNDYNTENESEQEKEETSTKENLEQDVYEKLIYDWQPFIFSIYAKNSHYSHIKINNKNQIFIDPKFFEEKILKYHYNDILERKVNENYWRLFDYFILGSDVPNQLLNLCYVDNSSIQGKGVFANCDIAKNSLITLMPNHIMWFNHNFWYHPIYYKDKIKKKDFYDKKKKIFGIYSINCYNVEICGDPKFKNDTAYMGHLINDGIGPFHQLIKHDKEKRNRQIQKIYSDEKVQAKTNVDFICWKNYPGIYVKSNKNIKKGEELLVSYGKNYWYDQYKRKHNI